MKTRLTILLSLILGILSAQQLAVVGKGKNYGYMDSSGKIVIPIEYKAAGNFSDGLAAVNINGKWGFIDATGKMVIEPQFDRVKSFNSGIALVESNKNWMYIDKTGKEITGFPVSDKKYDFEDGIAFIRQGDKVGFMDTKGNTVLAPAYKDIKPFNKGWAKFNDNDKWGLLSKDGKVYIPAEYDEINVSDNKVIIARKGTDWGLIGADKNFKVVNGASKIWEFFGENGTLTYAKKNDKIGFIDTTGNWVIEPQFEKVRAFNQGLAPVFKDKKWGYIDTNGNMVIPNQFKDAEIFSNDGLAPVKKDKLWGFIDKSGNMVIPDQYDISTAFIGFLQGGDQKGFINGLARVKYKKQWGFINKSGQVVGEWFDNAENFADTK